MTKYIPAFIVGMLILFSTVSAAAISGNDMNFIGENLIWLSSLVGADSVRESSIDADSSASATRVIQNQNLVAGSSTNITVTIINNISQPLSLMETLPLGWVLTRISDDASSFKPSTNEWAWFNIGAGITKTVIYSVDVPVDTASGTYFINGSITNVSGVIANVTGDLIINISSQPSQTSAIANRDIQNQNLVAGSSTNITVTIINNISQPLSLMETLPLGWVLTRISDDASSFKPSTNEWAWFNIGAGITKTVIYSVDVPVDTASGTYFINGSITNVSGVIANVTGETLIDITADTTPPASVTNLRNVSYAETYINWTWTDPVDIDFSQVRIYVDGTFQTIISKGIQFYNATGLAQNTEHTIATRTVDVNGNINQTWINHTARTMSEATPPGDGNITVKIVYPTNNSSFLHGEILMLAGNATGGTSPYTYNWTSNIDGLIGTISSEYNDEFMGDDTRIFTSSLNPGNHTITLRATDAMGLTNNTSIKITVLSTNTTNISGQSAAGAMTWNTSNFQALGNGEELKIASLSGRDVLENGLFYNTTKQIIPYKVYSDAGKEVDRALDATGYPVSSGGYYAKVGLFGESYVALKGKASKLARLVLEQNENDSKTLAIGSTWDMGQGYTLKLNGIDALASPRQVWLTLNNSEGKLDDKVVATGSVYTYVARDLGYESDVPMFVTYVDSIITNSTGESFLRLKYTWLVSDNPIILRAGDQIGLLTAVETIDTGVKMRNLDTTITLSQDSSIDIADGLRFKVSNNPVLQYHPELTVRNETVTVPPAGITNLRNVSYAGTYINWTWTDPIDIDFSQIKIYIDGIFRTIIVKGTQFYNATGLTPDTEHTISTRTMDTSGNVNESWVNHTARTAPLPSSLSVVVNNGIAYTNSTEVILGLSATNAEQMSFSNDNVSWSEWETFSATRSWTLTGGDGLKTVYFRARNSAGEALPVSDTIILDTTPPLVQITSPANDTIVNTVNINVTVNATDSSGIKTVCFEQQSGTGGDSRGCGGGGINNLSISLTYNITLQEGRNLIRFTYIDTADNAGSASVNITLDSTPPDSITGLANMSYAGTYINWTWIDPADSDFSKVMVYMDGTFLINVSKGIRFYNATNLSPGTQHSIETRTVDAIGNINQSWKNHTAKTAPVPSSLSIVINNGNNYTNSTSVILGLSATNAGQMSFSNDGITWSAWESFSNTKSWTLTVGDGLKKVYFKAMNFAGEASAVNDTINLDTTPPAVQITSPANGTVIGTANITIAGTASDSSGLTTECLEQQPGVAGGEDCGVVNNLTSMAFTYNLTLREGLNFIRVAYTDSAGNRGNASVNVTLDTIPPASIASLVNTSYAGSYINWTWTDPADADFVKVIVYVDGTFKENVSKGVRIYRAEGLTPDTQHTIATRTVDAVGNVNQTWTNHTARTAPAPSQLTIVINSGAEYTNSTSVTLNLSASNAEQMSFSNDSVSWSQWENFSNTKPWTLTGDDGSKKVYFRARNIAGEAPAVNDTILLDTTYPVISFLTQTPANGSYVRGRNVTVSANLSELGNATLVWNGSNKETKIQVTELIFEVSGLQDKEHSFRIYATDRAGNSALSETRFITVDNISPNISDVNATPTASSVRITWNTNELADSMIKYGTNVTNLNKTQSVTVYALSRLITLSELNPNTTYYYRANSTDRAGNSNESDILTFTTLKAPKIAILSPAEGQMINVARVEWQASDDLTNAAYIHLSLDGAQVATLHTAGNESGNVTLTPSDGLHNVEVWLADSSHNRLTNPEAIDVANFTLDRTPPEIQVLEPLNNEVKSTTALTIRANLSDNISGINISTVELFINGTRHYPSISQSGSVVTVMEPVNLSEDIHNVTIRVKDNTTNQKETDWNFTIAIPPSITSQTPASGSFVNSSSVTISARLSDNESGINAFATRILLDGMDDTANSTRTKDLISLVKADLGDGKHSITIEAFDNRSNKATSTWDFTVDTAAPEANISDPQENETLKYFENIVRGTVSDNNIQSAKLTVKNGPEDWLREYPLNLTPDDGMYKFVERVEFAGDQNNTIELFAQDTAGNTNITSITVQVRNNTYVNETNVTQGNATIINARDESDTEIEFVSNVTRNVTFTVKASTNKTLTDSVNDSARIYGEVALGKIVEINVTGLNATDKAEVKSVTIKLFYTKEDLEVKGLDENNLFIYWFNTTSENWTKLVKDNPPWVLNNSQVKIAGNNSGYVWVEVEHLSTFAIVGSSYIPAPAPTATAAPTSPGNGGSSGDSSSGSGGGGGGGGGGGASGEDPKNIVVKEKYDLHIFKDKVTSYRFTNSSNPVMFINITGNTSAGEINAAVEVLRSTSSLVKAQAPGTVYKNINMWVGTSGFAVPKNIKDAAIKFRIENSWLSSNNLAGGDIRLAKWDGSKWVQLETVELVKDNTHAYFEARTNSFSSFAITGIKTAASPEETKVAETVGAVDTSTAGTTPSEEAPPTNMAIIIGVIILIAIIVAAYIKIKDRPKK